MKKLLKNDEIYSSVTSNRLESVKKQVKVILQLKLILNRLTMGGYAHKHNIH